MNFEYLKLILNPQLMWSNYNHNVDKNHFCLKTIKCYLRNLFLQTLIRYKYYELELTFY